MEDAKNVDISIGLDEMRCQKLKASHLASNQQKSETDYPRPCRKLAADSSHTEVGCKCHEVEDQRDDPHDHCRSFA